MAAEKDISIIQPTEQIHQREEYSKTYAVGPARYRAFNSSVPLHVRSQDAWEEIDARFVPDKEYGDDSLASRGGHLTAVCSPSGEAAFITVKDSKEHSLSWGIAGSKTVVPEAVEEKIPETKDPAEGMFLEAMYKAQGHVRYPEIHPGVTMTCHMDGRFKDCFVYQDHTAAKPVTFIIKTSLHPEFKEDGSVILRDEKDETVFILTSPTLFDAAGNAGSVKTDYSLTVTGFTLTYTPDAAFMETAAYPLTLDPAVSTVTDSTAVADTYVNSAYPSQNYKSNAYIAATNDGSSGQCRGFLKFDPEHLPALGSNHFMTRGELVLRVSQDPTSETAVYAREITSTWDINNTTWSNQPSFDTDKILDYVRLLTAGTYQECRFDITSLVRKWYEGTNCGVAVTGTDQYPSGGRFFSVDSTSSLKPYLSVSYSSLAGLEGYLTYDSVSAGRAGTGHVSLVNGNLTWLHQDTVTNGLRMPVSVTHVYNSCDTTTNAYGVGRGWRTNYHLTLHKEYLDSKVWYVYEDGDGTEHWFKPPVSGNVYKDEDGLGLELTVASSNVTIRDKGDNKFIFPAVTGTPTASSPKTAKKLISSIKDAYDNEIVITSTVTSACMKINSIRDGAGRTTEFTYNNNGNYLSSIKAPCHETNQQVSFSYVNGNLRTVTYEDGNTTAYTYLTSGDHRLLRTAKGPENVTVTFNYTNTGVTSGLPHVVTGVTVTGGTLTARDTSYTYGSNLCLVTDNQTNKTLRYHFNNDGNATGVDDALGCAVFAEYDRSGSNENTPVNHPTSVSRVLRTVNNLLSDGLMCRTSGSPWSKGGTGTVENIINGNGFGRYEKKLTVANGNTLYLRQSVTVTGNKTYTLSGYAKSEGPEAFLRATVGSSTYTSPSITQADCTDGLTRLELTFNVPSGITAVTADLCAKGISSSTVCWWDSAQLEEGETANHVNLLENTQMKRSSGSGLPDLWLAGPNSNNFLQYKARSGGMPTHVPGDAIRVMGRYDRTIRAYQDINVSGSAGDRISLGGWCSAYTKRTDAVNSVFCQIYVLFGNSEYSDWTQWTYGGDVNFHHEESSWQFTCGNITAPCNFNWMRVVLYLNRQMNYADFTNLFVYKEAFGTDYVYDAKGNVKNAKSSAGNTGKATWDDYNNMLTSAVPGRTVTTSYTWGTAEADKRKHLLRSSTSPLGTYSTFDYDSYGNCLYTKTAASTSGSAKFIKTTTEYTAADPDTGTWAGNYVAKQADARKKELTTVTHPLKGTVSSVTDPKGKTVTYAYDGLRRLTQSTGPNGSKTYYTYTSGGQVQTVKHNTTANTSGDVTYTFGYDALTRPTTVQVGTATLSTTSYNTDGTVQQVKYGGTANNNKVRYFYDEFKRLKAVRFDTAAADRFTYAYNAQGQAAYVKDSVRNTTVKTLYDLAGRPMRKTLLTGTNHTYTGEVSYNQYELLQKFTEYVGTNRTKYTTEFTYDTENKPTALSYTNGSLSYTYDTLNRITNRTVNPGTAVATSYTYTAGSSDYGSNSTTNLVKTIVQGGVTLTYTYDKNGNITNVSNGTKQTEYVYDDIGQLIRVNDQTDLTFDPNGTGTTWKFTYDLGGNITSKKAYKYNTSNLYSSISYTYGTSGWKDQLTAYGTDTISYDDIGNPLSDGTWTYTWAQGRQLQSMARPSDSYSLTYEYNEDGLRTKKTSSTGYVSEYTWHGTKLTHMKRNTTNMHFFYDAQSRPAILRYGTSTYGYLYNLQGDVVAIVDSTGAKVVEYTYDAWGKQLTCTGSKASTVGTYQPFRYRGYIYDFESGLYYLMSRYYNPTWGRFINTDSIIKGNLYCYCYNNSISLYDASGNEAETIPLSDPTLLFYLYEGLKAILGGVSTGTSSVILSLGLVMIPARTASDEAGDVYTLSEFINLSDENASLYTQLKTAKEKALASTKTPLFPTNRHHIVAQFDIRAKPSWPILKKANINRFYDEENIVQVSTKMHWYMHTNLYHDSVYGVLYIADQWPLGEYSCNVRFALGTIKVLIEAIDQAE